MTSETTDKGDVGSLTSARWFVAGGVLSVFSAVVLAQSGTVCVEPLKILTARDASEWEMLGQRLRHVSWCPLGIAVGTTLIAAGFRRSLLRGRLSRRCLGLVGLYGFFAAFGAFSVFLGTSVARNAMMVAATSNAGIKPEEILAAFSEAAALVTRGWWLLVVAQVLLSIGGLVHFGDQSTSLVGSRRWPWGATMTLSLLWIFGAILSLAWFWHSAEILQLRDKGPVKPSEIVQTIDGVMSISCLSSVFLFGHAVLATVVAVMAYRALARSRETQHLSIVENGRGGA